jgi:two-component system response regulator HydG
MQEVMRHVDLVSPTDLRVLIEGETGSGKEYIARAIHQASQRHSQTFVAIDCGALPKELANSEMFGHIKGAFTGAVGNKTGYFEQAKGGTLFLDEVGNLSYDSQAKLLRALQENVIHRLGDNKTIPIDVRVIAASNEDLLEQVHKHNFREDLYHRLNGFKIKLPPLRERKEDITVFTEYYIKKANKAFDKKVVDIHPNASKLLLDYDWFGNIRELQNVVNRAVLLTKGSTILPDVLPEEIRFNNLHRESRGQRSAIAVKETNHDLKDTIKSTEKEAIIKALHASKNNKSKAAKLLNIDRKTLYNKLKLYQIDLDDNINGTN